ncbi:MAG: NAD(P)/FAD-dependent oxidoreductase [Planctomycetota bacterium]
MTSDPDSRGTAAHPEGVGVDVAVVGAGAAGLMAAIQAARGAPGARVVALDGARTLGAKILVAGGGRCNVTHREVGKDDFCGSRANAIGKVLKAFGVADTIAFFRERGVLLKEEDTGKLFPTTDRARSVLDALLGAAREAGVRLLHPARVTAIERTDGGFLLTTGAGPLRARHVVLATGGKSLPKSGSDGGGYALARALGHTIAEPLVPALSPLLLPAGHPALALAGVAAPARLTLRGATGAVVATATGPVLHTHFGLSGPAVLDISRHVLMAKALGQTAHLEADWRPDLPAGGFDAELLAAGRDTLMRRLESTLPTRLAARLLAAAGVDPATRVDHLKRDDRKALVKLVTAEPLPVTGDRGWTYAEATAGGVPLSEVDVSTMASRITPGLWLVGEILDVDGRLGGFNFQWAWASGTVAGRGLARRLGENARLLPGSPP